MKLGEELGFGLATAAAVATEKADARTVRMKVRCIFVDGQMLDWCGPMKSERFLMVKGVVLLRLCFSLLLLLMRTMKSKRFLMVKGVVLLRLLFSLLLLLMRKEGNQGFFICFWWKWR